VQGDAALWKSAADEMHDRAAAAAAADVDVAALLLAAAAASAVLVQAAAGHVLGSQRWIGAATAEYAAAPVGPVGQTLRQELDLVA